MSSAHSAKPEWGSTYGLVATEKWKAKSAAMGREVTEALVNYARPKPGMKILDLASGTGEPAITLAERVGPEGHVTALDLSRELLETAAGRARQRGLTNLSTRHADAHELPFPEQSFDLVTSRFGVMFLDHRALHEAHRVLKPEARACFLVWGPPDQPFWSSMWGVVHKFAGGPLTAPDQDPFKYAKAGSLSAALRDAGFPQVKEETKTLPWRWPGAAEEVWQLTQAVATPFLPMLKRIPAERWEQVNGEVLQAVQQYAEADGINFGAVVVFASGAKA
jgi:SAM-dependent methyltransferase